MTKRPPAIIGVLQGRGQEDGEKRLEVGRKLADKVSLPLKPLDVCVIVSILLYGGNGVALSGSSLLQSHVVPFKHQIPVETCRHKHTHTQRAKGQHYYLR